MPLAMRRGEPNRKANIATARFIPLLLVGIIGYTTWVVTDLVAIKYLIHPDPGLGVKKRPGIAAAILAIHYIILTILLICYGRLVQTIVTNPGLVPRGPQWYVEEERKAKQRFESEKDSTDTDSGHGYGKIRAAPRPDAAAYRVQEFWHKDVFLCNFDGRPPFCSHCYNFKPDRAHHCSELGRCVYKMDHFCPWVGGIVSETSFKYFIQFTFWTSCFTTHILIFTAYFFAERQRRDGFVNVHWILTIAFAGLFFIFGNGMCSSSMQFALQNTTTIENLGKKSYVWFVAVHIPEPMLQKYYASGRNDLRLITHPRPASEQLQVLTQNGVDPPSSARSFSHTVDPTPPATAHIPSSSAGSPHLAMENGAPPPITRTFTILESKPGQSPFYVSGWTNFREVMGYHIFDWFAPVRASPCTDHDNPESMYKTGSVLYEMKKEAGILEDELRKRHRGRSRRRRKRRRSSAAQSDSHV